MDNLSGVQYSPLDMAEYVFWTGDEKGVTLAIEEFLQEGLVSDSPPLYTVVYFAKKNRIVNFIIPHLIL